MFWSQPSPFTQKPISSITIPATSELVFSNQAVTLNVGFIRVHGKLIAGSETCPILGKIDITFHGSKSNKNDIGAGMGTKGIGVFQSGVLELHGLRPSHTWTRLRATANMWENRAYVFDFVDWKPGQRVVVATSQWKDELYNQNEVMTIKNVQGRIIEFTENFQYNHYGGQEYQAEVRLFLPEGETGSAWTVLVMTNF